MSTTGLDHVAVASARKIVMAARYEKDGMSCPCCEQFAKVYKRSITLTEVKILAKIYDVVLGKRPIAPTDQWVKIGADGDLRTQGGDFAKLRFWSLIEEREGERPDGSKRAGYWRITELGIQFLLGTTRVPRYVWIYNNQVVAPPDGVANKNITVYDVAKSFDFQSIMRTK